MTAFAPTFDESRRYFEARLPGQRIGSRREVSLKCPFHDDGTASMAVNLERGTWFCHACNEGGGLLDFERRLTGKPDAECWAAINATIGRDAPKASKSKRGPILATYDYTDAAGKLVYQSLRYAEPKKEFLQRRPDGKGDHIWNMDGVTRVPFNLPKLITANVALIAEGEKDALNLQKASAGFPDNGEKWSYAATCNVSGAGKWLDSYSPHLAGQRVFVFQDNDDAGRKHGQQVCASVSKYAQTVQLVELPGLPEHGDVSDYLQGHSPSELFTLMQSAPLWTSSVDVPQPSMTAKEPTWTAEGMDTFLTATDADIPWLVPDVLAPGCMTQFYAPRGLGKSLLADHWAVKLSASGKRVLILDRDNPRHTLRTRLHALGANDLGDLRINLKVISREKCPPLTKPEKWAAFPYSDYDLVIVDSMDAMAEGVGEQDSSKPSKAMVPLLDICHRENGPAVLLLGNTIKSAAHSRGSGVIEDRADIVYELRDGTDFRPTGQKPWIEELPAQGASEWAARSGRRKGRTRFRLAMVATKFRLGEEPAPRMLEVCMDDLPWTVTDVTASIDAAGEAERLRLAEEKATKMAKGVAVLVHEIDSRLATGQPAILKTDAEVLLQNAGYTRKDARAIIANGCFRATPGDGKGHPMELHNDMKVAVTAEMQECSEPNKNADAAQADSRRPHLEHTAEISTSQTLMNTGDLHPPISAANPILAGEKNGGVLFDVEI